MPAFIIIMEFIVALKEHRHLGFLLVPHFVQLSSTGGHYDIKENVVSDDVRTYPDRYTAEQKQIAILASECSETHITKSFGGRKCATPQEFFASHDAKYIDEYVRPAIDKKIVQILNICRTAHIGVYYKDPALKTVLVDDRIEFASQKAEAVFNFVRTDEETQYFLTVKYKDKVINLLNKNVYVLTFQPCVCVINRRILFFDRIDAKKLVPFISKKYIPVQKRVEQQYYQKFILNTIKENFIVNPLGFKIITQNPEPKAVLMVEHDLEGYTVFVLKFRYNGIDFLATSRNLVVVKFIENNGDYMFTKLVRNTDYEQEVENAAFDIFKTRVNPGTYRIKSDINDPKIQEAFAINCLNNNKEQLVQAGITIEQNLSQKNYYTGSIRLDMRVKNRTDWFDIYAIVKLDGLKIPFVSLKYYIINDIHEFTLPDGHVVVLPDEWFERFRDMFISGSVDKDSGNIILKKYQYLALMSLPLDSGEKDSIAELEKKLSDFDSIPMEQPHYINAQLRPYQITAYNWLKMMRDYNFGACLADDMGLGKTLCTLSVLANSVLLTDDSPRTDELFTVEHKIPSLLLVPKSLIYNWKAEAKKFAPQLKIIEYSGNNRQQLVRSFKYYDVVIAGYSIMRNDIQYFEKQEFNYVILDESQMVKNPLSKTYLALMNLRCRHRLTLTGTPLENSLTDLWSQMNFINPGLLGSLQVFKKRFVSPIEKASDEVASEKLQKLIYPFILRRTKQQVLNDLPEKIEQTIFCEMTDSQAEIYEREKSKVRNQLLDLMDKGLLSNSTMDVIQGLVKLRQIACSPALVDNAYQDGSGKTDEIMMMLQSVVDQGHKVLVFSSFVKHLDLIANELQLRGLDYAMLTGQTEERENEVEKFLSNNEVSVFLISIKAGGTGLNLTQADYVFIIDPWWNPAVEEQAIARAHRIGQKNSVMVYRFISAGTVEEKIQVRQQKKAGLAAAFVNETTLFNPALKEDVMEILG